MPSDTRTALLDHAERAIRARGVDGFSYADLAAAIGIRKASIHYHFPKKADLSEALMARYYQVLEGTLAQIDAKQDSGAARLLAVIDFYRAALNNGQTLCLCIAYIGSRESLSDTLITMIADFRDMVADWLALTFARGRTDLTIADVQDPHLEARATLALLEGAHLAARAAERVIAFDEAVALIKKRLRADIVAGKGIDV